MKITAAYGFAYRGFHGIVFHDESGWHGEARHPDQRKRLGIHFGCCEALFLSSRGAATGALKRNIDRHLRETAFTSRLRTRKSASPKRKKSPCVQLAQARKQVKRLTKICKKRSR